MRPLAIVSFYWLGDRWSGDGRGAEYVNKLFRGVQRNLTEKAPFICFTNEDLQGLDDGIITRRFKSPSERGVLPRLYMYSRDADLFGYQVLALDLDIVIVGSLDDLAAYRGSFCVRSKFAPGQRHKLDGDIISFRADKINEARLWTPFDADPSQVEEITSGRERYWYRHVFQDCDRWDKIAPGQVISYKRNVRNRRGRLPAGARIVSCHGTPRPHEMPPMDQRWIARHWK